jgi:hypothetical protein
MRSVEWPPVGQRAALDHPGDRSDDRYFEEFGGRERRQDRRQPRRQHGFAGAGRSDHQKVMAAGGGDFERALGAFLTLDVGEIEDGSARFQNFWLWPRQNLRAFDMIGELNERARGDDLDFRTGPSRFRSATCGADQALAAGIRSNRGRQHAGDRCDRTVKAELAEHGEAGQRIVRDGADRRHQPERDRQT